MRKEFYFAQKAFIFDGDRLLLIQKSSDDPNQAGKWEVPGGRMKFGEEPDDHLRREVIEEVGLDVHPGTPFYLWQWQLERLGQDGEPLQMQIVAVARLCTFRGGAISFKGHEEDDYIADFAWVSLSEALHYDLIPNMVPVVQALKGIRGEQGERVSGA